MPSEQPKVRTRRRSADHCALLQLGRGMQPGRQTALVADDDEFFRMAISSILCDRLGVSEVIQTGSLDEALERLGETAGITMALFDLAMPGVESAASIGAIRELFPDIRVAIVSSSDRRQDILKALEVGVHGYVPKGLGIDELTDAIRVILNGAVYVPESLSKPPSPGPARPQGDVGPRLTPRQKDVLQLLVEGKSNKEIARNLDLGEGTVKIHMAALFRALGVRNRSSAAVLGARLLGSPRDQLRQSPVRRRA